MPVPNPAFYQFSDKITQQVLASRDKPKKKRQVKILMEDSAAEHSGGLSNGEYDQINAYAARTKQELQFRPKPRLASEDNKMVIVETSDEFFK